MYILLSAKQNLLVSPPYSALVYIIFNYIDVKVVIINIRVQESCPLQYSMYRIILFVDYFVRFIRTRMFWDVNIILYGVGQKIPLLPALDIFQKYCA